MRMTPKKPLNNDEERMTAARAPKIAPGMVEVSSRSPSLIFVKRVLVYILLAVQDVATIATRLLPIAI